jgi:hypothetical protein
MADIIVYIILERYGRDIWLRGTCILSLIDLVFHNISKINYSNINGAPVIFSEGFLGFSQFLQANAGIVPLLGHDCVFPVISNSSFVFSYHSTLVASRSNPQEGKKKETYFAISDRII